MKKQFTEIRLNISDTQEAIQYWLNNYLLRKEVGVESVTWDAKAGQFKVSLISEGSDLPT